VPLESDEWTARDGIPTTTVARTLLDLAQVVDAARLRRAWEEADRLNLLRLGSVEDLCRRSPSRKGIRVLRILLAEAAAPTTTRSPLEDRFLAFCRDHRLPTPATNILILGKEVDAYWPSARLAVELDSFGFHRHRAAFERDRARDAAFLAAGYRVIRLTDRRLEQEGNAVAAQLRELLAT
jgi:very-short-patch-repair endonuclease